MNNLITVVDKNNKIVGSEDRLKAQQQGLWHRISIVLIFNSQNELYIQKRSPKADSSPNLWDHSAAGHVDADETPQNAAKRELKEELGISANKLKHISIYKTQRVDGDKIFNRYWYLYRFDFDGKMNLQKTEVTTGKFVDVNWLKKDLRQNPDIYTDGIKKSLQVYLDNKK